MVPESYDVLCSIADLIDQLSIANIKISRFHHAIVDERCKENPSPTAIVDNEGKCRRMGEKRVLLRDEINRRIDEAIRRGGIRVETDARTFDMRGI